MPCKSTAVPPYFFSICSLFACTNKFEGIAFERICIFLCVCSSKKPFTMDHKKLIENGAWTMYMTNKRDRKLFCI